MYLSINTFYNDISTHDPQDLVRKWLNAEIPHAFKTAEKYQEFIDCIKSDWPDSSSIQVAGTSSWKYSLNPKKNFSEYHNKSDVDVVIISKSYFEQTWEILRQLHRKRWYSWPQHLRDSVMRTGVNVYCGFISPKHIPDQSNSFRFSFLSKCNSYSTKIIGYRDVNMMFFKSQDDALDYYVRGVRLAKRRI
jgi:hypothetical protein